MGRPGPWSYPARYQEGRVGGGVPQSSASTALLPRHPTPVPRGSGVWEATPRTATGGHLPPNSRLPRMGASAEPQAAQQTGAVAHIRHAE